MRSLAHLCAIVLVLPQVLLASALAIAGFVVAERTVRSILMNALTMLDLLFSWLGLAMLVVGAALLVAGFSTRFRVAASWLVIAIAVSSGFALGLRMGFSFAGESWWLFTPALLSIAISGWSLSRERSRVLV